MKADTGNHALRLVTTSETPTQTGTFDGLTALSFIESCYRLGLSFVDNMDVLSAGPSSLLTDEICREIKKRKLIILRYLRSDPAKGEPCKVCRWKGDTWDRWCEFCFDPAIEAELIGHELILVRV